MYLFNLLHSGIFYGKEKDYSQYEEMEKQIFDMQK